MQPTSLAVHLLLLATAFLGPSATVASATVIPLPFQNLALDAPGFPGQPRNWFVSDHRATRLDKMVKHGGVSSLRIDAASAPQQVGTDWPAGPWRGQLLTLSGFTRTSPGQMVQGTLTFGTCSSQPCPATTSTRTSVGNAHDWTAFTLTFRVPADAQRLSLVAVLSRGTLWLDEVSLTANGVPVPEAAPFLGPNASELAWLKTNARAVRVAAAPQDTSDLEPLGQLIGPARVVGLGEGTHGTSEFFTLKARLVRYLVTQRGFRIFALEESAAAVDAVDRYLQTGQGDPATLLSGSVWHVQEVLDLLRWMRAYNVTAAQKLRFASVDLRSTDPELRTLQDLVARAEPEYLGTLQDLVVGLSSAPYFIYGPVDPGKRAAYQANRALAGEIVLHLQHREVAYRRVLSPQEVETALRYATRLWQFTGMPVFGPFDYRDRTMARNLEGLARQFHGQKIILWAHDGHVMRLAGRMGEVLGQDFGAEYVPVGTLFGEGTYSASPGPGQALAEGNIAPPMYPGSLEQAFSQVGGSFFLNLRAARAGPAAWLNTPQDVRFIGVTATPLAVDRINLAQLFDAVVFVPHSTSFHLVR